MWLLLIGVPGLIKGDMIKEGATVIDIGNYSNGVSIVNYYGC